MKFQKVLFLFLALLLPVVIFIFLKSFGKNEFQVTPLFQEVTEMPADCAFSYQFPYVIPDSVLTGFSWNQSDSLILVVFDDSLGTNNQKLSNQLARITVELKQDLSYVIYTSNDHDAHSLYKDSLAVVKAPADQLLTQKKCVYVMKGDINTALVDAKGRIRGHYNLTDLDDADRLIMEVLIILKRY
jgi:hypothetical protein